MTASRLLATAAVAALVGAWGFAGAGTGHRAVAADSQKVDDFELPDQNLLAHHLYPMGADAKAIVLISQANGDKLVRANAQAYNALKTAYAGKGVEVFMLNATAGDTRESIAKEAADYHYDMPVLQDLNQLVAEQLELQRTGEVIVVDAKTWTIAYRGPVDDRVSRGATKSAATKTYAKDALDAVLAGSPVKVAHVAAPGSPIALLAAKSDFAKISYVKDVAPIIQEKCVSCHQAGGIGPMTLVNYEQVRGHALMIREVLRTKRMPPFHADPRIGHFANDVSLSADQIKTLVHWVEAGSPRGTGADPLGAQTFAAKEWPLGTPDVVLNIPAFTIPANGTVDYKTPWAAMPADFEDRWLRASTFKIDQRQGVHHILTSYRPTLPSGGDVTRGGFSGGNTVGTYAVGGDSSMLPPDSGTLLTKGGALGFQMHYTSFGKEVVDNTKVGLYFFPKGVTPTHIQHSSVITDPNIALTPNTNNWQDVAYITFPADAKLFSIFPHAHYRGRSASAELQYPDGRRETILAVPHWDFNWQAWYTFQQPIDIPAGTKLVAHMSYDNSKRNAANPDSSRTVPWGSQSWDEMFYVAFDYQWKDETSSHRTPQHDLALNTSRNIGVLDKNLNGKVEVAELNGRQFAPMKPLFSMLDRNGDGGLDTTELAAATRGRAINLDPDDEVQAAMPPARPTASATPSPRG